MGYRSSLGEERVAQRLVPGLPVQGADEHGAYRRVALPARHALTLKYLQYCMPVSAEDLRKSASVSVPFTVCVEQLGIAARVWSACECIQMFAFHCPASAEDQSGGWFRSFIGPPATRCVLWFLIARGRKGRCRAERQVRIIPA
jgi:hypothetical protein